MTQTIEQTAKRWKSMQAAGAALMVGGLGVALVVAMNDGNTDIGGAVGMLLALLGVGTYLAGRIGAWWYHA